MQWHDPSLILSAPSRITAVLTKSTTLHFQVFCNNPRATLDKVHFLASRNLQQQQFGKGQNAGVSTYSELAICVQDILLLEPQRCAPPVIHSCCKERCCYSSEHKSVDSPPFLPQCPPPSTGEYLTKCRGFQLYAEVRFLKGTLLLLFIGAQRCAPPPGDD